MNNYQSDFAALPAGEYLVMVTASELKCAKTGNGTYMNFTNQVLEGPYKGRLVFDRATVTSNNDTAQEIGRRAISAICHAVGKPSANESSELHNTPYIIRLTVKNDDKYGESNEVKGYKSIKSDRPVTTSRPVSTQAPATAQPQQQAEQPNQLAMQPIPPVVAATGAKPAWMRG